MKLAIDCVSCSCSLDLLPIPPKMSSSSESIISHTDIEGDLSTIGEPTSPPSTPTDTNSANDDKLETHTPATVNSHNENYPETHLPHNSEQQLSKNRPRHSLNEKRTLRTQRKGKKWLQKTSTSTSSKKAIGNLQQEIQKNKEGITKSADRSASVQEHG